jgi:hypothetical protein
MPARDPGFDEAFDDDTLFFDGFYDRSLDKIVIVGPALFNLASSLKLTHVRARPSGESCRFQVREFDRHVRVVVDAPAGTHALAFTGPLGAFELILQVSMAEPFAGTHMLATMSRNNDIVWIMDWVRYHRDRHGADAVLIYDNKTTNYDSSTMLEALRCVGGLKAAMVVNWPFKYGPQGTLEGFWDSDFCQYGMLEHARWRFAPEAAGVMNADIDELLVSSGREGVFDALARSRFGIVRYPGRWVVGVEGDPQVEPARVRRHLDYHIALKPDYIYRFGLMRRDRLRCSPKWTVAPRRCPVTAQWKTHTITGWVNGRVLSPGFLFRHFREIGDSWKYDRTTRAPFDPRRHFDDVELRRTLEGIDWER